MHFRQSFIILLTITASLILIPDRVNRVKAEEKIIRCKGQYLVKNVTYGAHGYRRIVHDIDNLVIPIRFDAREKWTRCRSLYHIKQQGACGGCWAFAAASVIEDRICISTGIDALRSEQDLMECCHFCVGFTEQDVGGCNGGFTHKAFEYWYHYGLVTGDEGCKPTEKKISQGIPHKKCRNRCTNRTFPVNYYDDKISPSYIHVENMPRSLDIRHIMAEIMLYGPVAGGMDTYEYMTSPYPQQGVLRYDPSLILRNEKSVGHAIKIIGWDEIYGIPVWIIANSWGRNWCNQGFCYVKRDNLGIEDRPVFGGIIVVSRKQTATISPKQNKTKTSKNTTETSGSNVIEITNTVVLMLCIFRM